MIYNRKELLNLGIVKSDYQINRYITLKKLYRIQDGIYTDKKWEYKNPNYILVTCKKYQNGIITMDTAFYLYALLDFKPTKVHIATRRDCLRINDDKICQTFQIDDVFEIGLTKMKINKGYIRIYDKERLLIELIRKKKYLDEDLYLKVMNNYKEIFDELNLKRLYKYIEYFSVKEYIKMIIEKEFLNKDKIMNNN